MRFEDLKRWHWMVIAILGGWLMAWLLSTTSGSANLTPTCSQETMEDLMYRPPVKSSDGKQFPWIRNIRSYPPVDASAGLRGDRPGAILKSAVTFEILEPAGGQNGWQYVSSVSLVDVPYRPRNRPTQDPTFTLDKYIAGLAKDRPWLQSVSGYAWWSEPRWMYVLWIGGSVLILGIIWPTVQNQLIGAGYGTRSSDLPEKQKKESFWKKMFGGQPQSTTGTGVAAKPSMTLSQDELDRIAQMEAGLKDFLKPGDTELGGEVDETKAPEIRQLNAEPIDAPAPAEKPKEDKDYGGEFYPTVAHGKKKLDNQP